MGRREGAPREQHDPREKSADRRGDARATTAQGGYFVINGSEKCLIAQEKMSNNHVYVFEKRMPCKYSFTAECRCARAHLPRTSVVSCVKVVCTLGAAWARVKRTA